MLALVCRRLNVHLRLLPIRGALVPWQALGLLPLRGSQAAAKRQPSRACRYFWLPEGLEFRPAARRFLAASARYRQRHFPAKLALYRRIALRWHRPNCRSMPSLGWPLASLPAKPGAVLYCAAVVAKLARVAAAGFCCGLLPRVARLTRLIVAAGMLNR